MQVASAAATSPAIEETIRLLKTKGFSAVAAFERLCPSAPKLRSVRLYHDVLQFLSGMGAGEWAKSEMNLCARYAAAILMQQVAQNQALAVEVSSF